MHSIDVGDGWFVTTPIYVGTDEQIEQAIACTHDFVRDERPTDAEGRECFLERCSRCVATRARYRSTSSANE